MLFSIVIPLYNKERYIADTIQSVLDQNYTDFELLIVDDGSTDGSRDVVEGIADPRIRLIKKENGGSSTARNLGFRESKGKYVCFLDADDRYLPGFLDNARALVEKYPEAGLYGLNYVFSRNGREFHPGFHGIPDNEKMVIVPDYFESVLYGEQVVINTANCIPKRVLEEVEGYDEGMRTTEDQDLWIRIALKHPVAFHHDVSAVYNLDVENAKTQRVPKHEIEYANKLQQWISDGRIPEKHLSACKRIVAANLIGVASMNILAGDKRTARKFLNDPRTNLLPRKKKYWKIVSLLPHFLIDMLYGIRRRMLNKR